MKIRIWGDQKPEKASPLNVGDLEMLRSGSVRVETEYGKEFLGEAFFKSDFEHWPKPGLYELVLVEEGEQ